MILSNPTKAPLRMKSTLEVSMWYTSGLAMMKTKVSYATDGIKKILRVAICGARCPPLVVGSPGGGGTISAAPPPFACTVTTAPSSIRRRACCTPSPPTSLEPSDPELDRRAILSISSMYTMPVLKIVWDVVATVEPQFTSRVLDPN